MQNFKDWAEAGIAESRKMVDLIERGVTRFHRQDNGGPIVETTQDELRWHQQNIENLTMAVAAISRSQ